MRRWLLLLLLCSFTGCVERSKSGSNTARLSQYILNEPPAVIPHPNEFSFGGKIRLLGHQITPEGSLRPGQNFKLTLYWQCDERLDGGWQLFTHLLDSYGNRLQEGHFDNVGPLREVSSGRQALPPSDWRRGKVYVDEQPLRVPADASGQISIAVGIWRDSQRLQVSPATPQDRPIVARIPITGSRAAPTHEPPRLQVQKLHTSNAPVIDGKLEDDAWKSAADTGPFVDVATGAPNRGFPVNGSAKITWDEKNLYLGFNVLDPKIFGGFSSYDRDQRVWEKSCVEIMIDPDGDGDNLDYYEIQISPQNIIFDSQFDSYNQPRGGPNGPFGHQEWNYTGKSTVVLRGTIDKDDDVDDGYTVEAVIAWSSFNKVRRIPPTDGDTWRMNFYAMKRNNGVAWSPILGQGNFHKANRFGYVTFLASPSPSSSVPANSSSSPAPFPSAASRP